MLLDIFCVSYQSISTTPQNNSPNIKTELQGVTLGDLGEGSLGFLCVISYHRTGTYNHLKVKSKCTAPPLFLCDSKIFSRACRSPQGLASPLLVQPHFRPHSVSALLSSSCIKLLRDSRIFHIRLGRQCSFALGGPLQSVRLGSSFLSLQSL